MVKSEGELELRFYVGPLEEFRHARLLAALVLLSLPLTYPLVFLMAYVAGALVSS